MVKNYIAVWFNKKEVSKFSKVQKYFLLDFKSFVKMSYNEKISKTKK